MRLGAWARLAVGAALVAVPIWKLGTGAFLDGLRAVGAAEVAAALGVGLLTTVASAWRWRLVARGLGLRLPLRTAVADYYAALLLNAVLPAGVLGDVRRAVGHGRASGDLGRGVRAVVLERVAGQAVLVAVGLLVLLASGPVPLPGASVNAAFFGGERCWPPPARSCGSRRCRASSGPAPRCGGTCAAGCSPAASGRA
ncbi:lysylphosphatidylglycerol synthase transmembrane domain-containing protein [Actinomadura namibiensis]|uniref:lysylphosphatidylglycerol synthase transmembrane domain-containing protein n=1 Tax=Actinomadura kijaniata TaxID=46161 RepID=UPI00360CDEC7